MAVLPGPISLSPDIDKQVCVKYRGPVIDYNNILLLFQQYDVNCVSIETIPQQEWGVHTLLAKFSTIGRDNVFFKKIYAFYCKKEQNKFFQLTTLQLVELG